MSWSIIFKEGGINNEEKLIAFGLLWVLVGCLVGMYLGLLHPPHIDKMNKIAQQGDLAQLWNNWQAWKTHAVCHTHILCFAFLSILIGLAMPEMKITDKTKNILGILYIIGVVFYSIFGWFNFLPVVVPASILIVVGVIMSFIGVVKGFKQESL